MRKNLTRVAMALGLLAVGVIPSVGQTTTPDDTVLIAKTDESESNADLTVLISQETFEQSSRVIFARDDAFADALASGVLQSDGPLMLVPTGGPVPDLMVDEIQRLGAREAVVLGGPAAVTTGLDEQLADMGLQVSRRQGASRFETAIEIAKQDAPEAETVMLARAFGANPDDPSQAFADSISAGGISAREGFPVLLTDTGSLNGSTREYLEDTPAVKRVLILGGTAAVSSAVEDELNDMGVEVERVAGASREDTAIELAKEGGDDSAADALRIIAADSTDDEAWAAGFAMASHAKKFDAPIVLTLGSTVPQSTKDFLEPGIGGSAFAQSTPVLTCVTSAAVCEEVRVAAQLPPAGQQPPDQPDPPAQPTPFNATQVTTGLGHSCGLAPDGSAWCWGQQGPALGYEGGASTTTPVPVTGGLTFLSLSAGASHTCGIGQQGLAYCWGSNGVGQLGDHTTTTSFAPRRVGVAEPLLSIDAGLAHGCAIDITNAVWCWGANSSGQLGIGTVGSDDQSSPQQVSQQLQFSAISAGAVHTCGISTGQFAYCWGDNSAGQLGNGTTENSAFPTLVNDPPGSSEAEWRTISAGATHTCGITTDGAAWCWGENRFGGLGDGTTASASEPRQVTPGVTYEHISAGQLHTCAVNSQEEAVCFGQNASGELGDGTNNDGGPVFVGGDLVFSSIEAGWDHTCAISLQSPRCWGLGSDGQLGDGTATTSSLPVQVINGSGS